MSSKPAPLESACKRGYFGRIVGSPPGLPGGGITGVLPLSGRRRTDFGIDAGGRAQYAVGTGQFFAERFGPLAGGGALRCGRAGMRRWLHRRAIGGARGRWRRGRRRGCRRRSAGPAHPPRRRPPSAHRTERASILLPCRENGPRARRFPAERLAIVRTCNFRTCGSGSAKNAPSAASAAVRSG